MSRIGKKPIAIPSGVTVKLEGDTVAVKGPKGQDELRLHRHVRLSQDHGALAVSVVSPDSPEDRALWGLHRALIANLLKGVTQGFEKKLELVGVGYKAMVQGKTLALEAGFSHPVSVPIPEGITCTVEKNVISIAGVNKQQVGQFAAQIREIRKPEPYKGKGIRYVGEVVRRKAGKAAKAAGVK